jgi:hypothetical protein
VALLGLTVAAACSGPERIRNPGPPVIPGGVANAAPQARAPIPTPPPERALAVAEDDVVAAGEAYVRALYAADDETAALYQPGYGPVLRKTEDEYELLSVSARPMTWGEAGYTNINPDLEFAEVVARVKGKKSPLAGSMYYKLGFLRQGDTLVLDFAVLRNETRE